MTALEVRLVDVTRTYGTETDGSGERVVALDRVDLVCAAGSTTALVGPSGSGKSTVLTLLAGLQRADSGELHVGRHALHELSQRALSRLRASTVAAVLQVPGAGLLPWASALENVELVRRHADVAEPGRDPAELLDRLGLTRVAGTAVARLSGGEQQRVALATALVHRPDVLLLDEVTSALDAGSRERVLDLLDDLRQEHGATVLIATHDAETASVADVVVQVRDGRLRS